MATWITLPSVSVTNGSITVSVTGAIDLSAVLAGWALIINGMPAEIASGTAADGSGSSTLTLATAWEGAAVVNQPAKVQPTGAPFLAGIAALEDTNRYAIDVHNTLAEIATLDKDVTIKDPTGTEHTFSTMPKIAREVEEFIDAAGTAAGYDVTESSTDNSSNRLTKVGDFGLGGKSPQINDFSTLGSYTHFSSQASPTNAPDGVNSNGNWWHTLKFMSVNVPAAVLSIKTHYTNGFPLGAPEIWVSSEDLNRKARVVTTNNQGIITKAATSSSDRLLVGTSTDNGVDKLQVNGSAKAKKIEATECNIKGSPNTTFLSNQEVISAVWSDKSPGDSAQDVFEFQALPNNGRQASVYIRGIVRASVIYLANDYGSSMSKLDFTITSKDGVLEVIEFLQSNVVGHTMGLSYEVVGNSVYIRSRKNSGGTSEKPSMHGTIAMANFNLLTTPTPR